MKVFIALSTCERKIVTKLCLDNLKEIVKKDGNSKLAIYDDASETYDEKFLKKFSKSVLRFRIRGGIERSRARSFRDFEYVHKDFDLLYITDNDTIHDPSFLSVLRDVHVVSSVSFEKKMPIGLFNSVLHSNPKNIIDGDESFSIRYTCPGVSQCYDRSMVSKIVDFLNKNPIYETTYGFDYHWPRSLGVPFLQTKTSYLEHFARDKDEHGLHSGLSEDPMIDFNRDRAVNPTSYLQGIRMKTIKKIMSG